MRLFQQAGGFALFDRLFIVLLRLSLLLNEAFDNAITINDRLESANRSVGREREDVNDGLGLLGVGDITLYEGRCSVDVDDGVMALSTDERKRRRIAARREYSTATRHGVLSRAGVSESSSWGVGLLANQRSFIDFCHSND